MVYSKPLNTLVILVLLSFAKGIFTPTADWPLWKMTADSLPSGFRNNIRADGSPYITPDTTVNIDSLVSCTSTSLSSQTWSLTGDITQLIGMGTEFIFGFWVNFQSTISTKVFQFEDDAGSYYIVSSTKDGALKVSFQSGSSPADPANDIPITVPLGNFYTDKWIFIAFHFNQASTVTLDIILPKTAMITKTSAAFTLPRAKFYFGMSIKAKFREVKLTKTATINGSYDTITLKNFSGITLEEAKPCNNPGTCTDDICNADSKCIASMDHCNACASNGCTSCDSDWDRSITSWCTDCLDSTFEIKNYRCCAVDHHCDRCSTTSTQCDVCAIGYFLHQESPTSTTCLSCSDSCIQCSPGPACYNCAETITLTESACRVDSVGFQISANLPKIELDFAYPLATGLTKNSFTAFSNSNAPIPTAGWTLTGCTAGLKQCSITTNNLLESDLPISFEFDLTQA